MLNNVIKVYTLLCDQRNRCMAW